jgi:sarcosine oxidase, subunit delta
MMQLTCPWCGVRDEPEFLYGGTTHIARPGPDASDQEWGEYLFFRDNPKGVHHERWRHAYGCGQWFNVVRNTVTHEVQSVYGMGESPP